jgi:hypothetical protein
VHRPERRAHRGLEIARAVLQRVGDEVREDLGVRLGREAVPAAGERRLELEVVLDDAVVNHRDAAVSVRVGVLVRRAAVRRPARVPDPGAAGQGAVAQDRHEVLQLALRSLHREPGGTDDRDARGVVAAVLELPEPSDDEIDALPGSDVTNDSAHGVRLLPRRARSAR